MENYEMLGDNNDMQIVPETPLNSTEISRRGLLRNATIVVGGAGALIAAMTASLAEADAAKMSQAAASYQTSPKNGQRCADCTLFQAPASCKLVEGNISPAGSVSYTHLTLPTIYSV